VPVFNKCTNYRNSNQRIPNSVSNDVVRSRRNQPRLSDVRPILRRRLSFFAHLCRADISHIKTILELFKPSFGVCPKNGDADRGKSGWERLRIICTRLISAWRQPVMSAICIFRSQITFDFINPFSHFIGSEYRQEKRKGRIVTAYGLRLIREV